MVKSTDTYSSSKNAYEAPTILQTKFIAYVSNSFVYDYTLNLTYGIDYKGRLLTIKFIGKRINVINYFFFLPLFSLSFDFFFLTWILYSQLQNSLHSYVFIMLSELSMHKLSRFIYFKRF